MDDWQVLHFFAFLGPGTVYEDYQRGGRGDTDCNEES